MININNNVTTGALLGQMVQNKKKNTKVVKDFAEELWEKQLEPLYLLRPIRGLPVLPSARLDVETAGFEPKRFVRTQPFLSRSVEKRADQSRFKSIGLYVDALMFTGAGTTTRLSPGSPTRPCCGCSSRTQGAMRCARRRARCFGAAAKKAPSQIHFHANIDRFAKTGSGQT